MIKFLINKKLIKNQENNTINLNMKNIINFDKEMGTNLELKKIIVTKDELIQILLNEVNELKKKSNKQKEESKNNLMIIRMNMTIKK